MVSPTTIVPIPYGKVNLHDFNTSAVYIEDGTKCVFSIVPKVPAKGILEVYENSIKFYNPNQPLTDSEPPERLENDIKNFSQKSRQRLFQIFNKINYSSYGIPLFLSLTFHFDSPDTRKKIKLFLRNYLKRLFRALPPFDYIWKFEYQKRGIPHYHMILFPHSKTYKFDIDEVKNICNKHWLELKPCKCEHCQEYAVNVIILETLKKSLSYIAKEIAKVSNEYLEHDLGRIWGTSRDLRTNKIRTIEITTDEYEKFINIAIENINKKILEVPPDKPNQIKKYEKSKQYLMGLKWIPFNSTVFISASDINNLADDFEFAPKQKSINKKLILKKYNWR